MTCPGRRDFGLGICSVRSLAHNVLNERIRPVAFARSICMTIYAIGDVQGCYPALQRLLTAIRFDAARDQLWFAGDVVNRGAESLQTLRAIMAMGDAATMVLGNHDLHLLARANGGRGGRRDTLDDILKAPDCGELMQWLRHRPLLHEAVLDGTTWVLVHAGIAPAWNLNTARRLALQVQAALRGPGHNQFLAEMYGDEPRSWTPALSGKRRLRYAVNAFTRMRYVADTGALEFKAKSAPAQAAPHLSPWFAYPGREPLNAEVIFGHWSTLGRVHWPEHRVWGLDTGAVWGGKLTALNLQTQAITQVDCPENRALLGAGMD